MENTQNAQATNWVEMVDALDEKDEGINRDDFDSFSEWRAEVIKRCGLFVGENYIDNCGFFTIKSIENGTASILRPSTGKEEIRDLESLRCDTLEKCLSDIAREKTSTNHHSKRISANDGRKRNSFRRKPFLFTPSNDFYRTLGYLAKHSNLYARILVSHLEKFHEDFFELKGYDPVVEPGVFCILKSNDGTCQFADEFSVAVRTPGWELDTGSIAPEGGKKAVGNKAYLNSTEMVWWLLEIGFNLGRPHDIEQIRSNVPDWFKESFDLGLKSE